jgi:hypothetical protein
MDLRAESQRDLFRPIFRSRISDNNLVGDAGDGLENPREILLFVSCNQTNTKPDQEATVYATVSYDRGQSLLRPRLARQWKTALEEFELAYCHTRSWAWQPTP